MSRPEPIPEEAAWLYQPARSAYPDSLTHSELMRACLSAANELGTRRPRTAAAKAQLAENIVHLLPAVAIREAYKTGPGSMDWDLTHCDLPLREAAANALSAEYRKARYRVLRWALEELDRGGEVLSRQDSKLVLTVGRRKASVFVWSHESHEGHIAAIARLDELRQQRAAGALSDDVAQDLPDPPQA